jgi:dCMP deaminase
MQGKWDVRFLRLAHEVAKWSKDPSTKVGCILVKDKKVISMGYNGFPAGISDDLSRLEDRSIKYEITVHAEVNAVTNAALHGLRLTLAFQPSLFQLTASSLTAGSTTFV